ncbi:MAG: hypothetical protein QOF90_2666, partial [Acetobacteraceae bacterium]|nr:hypothetical protein [Acetobacteraceae bacterium]
GTGYVEAEFDAAGIPFPRPGARVKIVAEMISELRRLLSDPDHIPPPVQTPPPIMVAAQGDKMLTLAAQQADIVAIASMGSEADLAGRVAFVKEKAAGRFDDIELQFAFIQVSMDDPSDLTLLRMLAPPDAPEEELRKLTTVLDGTVPAAVERIQRLHTELGISYFTFSNTPGTSWATFEKLVAALR